MKIKQNSSGDISIYHKTRCILQKYWKLDSHKIISFLYFSLGFDISFKRKKNGGMDKTFINKVLENSKFYEKYNNFFLNKNNKKKYDYIFFNYVSVLWRGPLVDNLELMKRFLFDWLKKMVLSH